MRSSLTSEHCRVCLENKQESMSISDPYPDEVCPTADELKLKSYMDVYKFVAEVHAEPASKLMDPPPSSLFFPRRICKDCVAQLQVAYEFHRKVFQSENILKNILSLCGQQDLPETMDQETEVAQEEEVISNIEVQAYEYLEQHLEECSTDSEHDAQINLGQADSNPQPENYSDCEKPKSRDKIDWKKRTTPCEDCGKIISNPYLRTHRLMHTNGGNKVKRTSQCEDCGKIVTKGYLRIHRLMHTNGGKKERPFACEMCDKRYSRKVDLNMHQRSHSNDKRYKCPHCGETFLHWSTRKNHIARIHTGEKPFTCEVCGKKFSESSHYYPHIRRHAGVTNYACELCDRKFVTVSCKQIHMLTHTDAKNFPCDVCGKSFKSPKTLRFHVRTLHDQEKNYVCPVCKRAFTQNHALRHHLLKTHPEHERPPPGTIVSLRALELIKKQEAIDASIAIAKNASLS